MLFTWASRGKATAYVYDLNSATAARDGLEHTLRLLLRSNAEKVNVLAHSMGNWVTVEAFRQIRISGDLSSPPTRSATIFLAAPDIDIDVFKSQLRRFGKPQKPFYVVLSQDDRALFLSRTIAGGVTRVGDNPDVPSSPRWISGDLPPANKIGTIVLAAPDIDIDVFKSQLRRFGKPQKPFYVVLSQDDRAFFLSRTIAGGVTRVGDSSRYRGARGVGGDGHRSYRREGRRRHKPR